MNDELQSNLENIKIGCEKCLDTANSILGEDSHLLYKVYKIKDTESYAYCTGRKDLVFYSDENYDSGYRPIHAIIRKNGKHKQIDLGSQYCRTVNSYVEHNGNIIIVGDNGIKEFDSNLNEIRVISNENKTSSNYVIPWDRGHMNTNHFNDLIINGYNIFAKSSDKTYIINEKTDELITINAGAFWNKLGNNKLWGFNNDKMEVYIFSLDDKNLETIEIPFVDSLYPYVQYKELYKQDQLDIGLKNNIAFSDTIVMNKDKSVTTIPNPYYLVDEYDNYVIYKKSNWDAKQVLIHNTETGTSMEVNVDFIGYGQTFCTSNGYIYGGFLNKINVVDGSITELTCEDEITELDVIKVGTDVVYYTQDKIYKLDGNKLVAIHTSIPHTGRICLNATYKFVSGTETYYILYNKGRNYKSEPRYSDGNFGHKVFVYKVSDKTISSLLPYDDELYIGLNRMGNAVEYDLKVTEDLDNNKLQLFMTRPPMGSNSYGPFVGTLINIHIDNKYNDWGISYSAINSGALIGKSSVVGNKYVTNGDILEKIKGYNIEQSIDTWNNYLCGEFVHLDENGNRIPCIIYSE